MGDPLTDKISLSALINGFSEYGKTWLGVAQHPLRIPDALDAVSESSLKRAIGFCGYSFALIFFMLVPMFAKYGLHVSKLTFIIRYAVQFAFYMSLMHVALRLVGRSKNGLRDTAVTYSYVVGVGAPLSVLVEYPVLLSVGPSSLWGSPKEVVGLQTFYATHVLLWIYVGVVVLLLESLVLAITVCWFAKTHQVRKLLVVLSLFVAGLVATPVQIFVLNPVFTGFFKLVDEWAKYA